jgi:hypothetical protein
MLEERAREGVELSCGSVASSPSTSTCASSANRRTVVDELLHLRRDVGGTRQEGSGYEGETKPARSRLSGPARER